MLPFLDCNKMHMVFYLLDLFIRIVLLNVMLLINFFYDFVS